jgi:hypothetical protein
MVSGRRAESLPTLPPMQQQLRVDTAGVLAMATRWDASVGDLNETVAPTALGLSCQTSAAAVSAAHVDVTAFMASLAARVGAQARHVADVDTLYIDNEISSVNQLAAVADPVAGV